MVAESVVPPASGHGIPSEVDLEAPEAVLKWMSTFGGETYEEYGKKIVAAHYDSMHTLNFTEEELTQLSIPKPHARRIVAAAQSVTTAVAHSQKFMHSLNLCVLVDCLHGGLRKWESWYSGLLCCRWTTELLLLSSWGLVCNRDFEDI